MRTYVREQAFAALADVQPEITPASLNAFIADPSSAPELLGKAAERLFDVATVHAAAGEHRTAEGIVRLIRARAKNRNLAYAGTTLLSEVRRRAAGADAAAQEAAIGAVFRELPSSRLGAATVVFQIFQTQEMVQAQLGQIQQQLVSMETASGALFFSQLLPAIVDHRERFLAAIATVRGEHEAQPARAAYSFGTIDLSRARDAQEVRVAVWDVGTEPELFQAQLFANPGEQRNGADDDGNGLVDDLHGVVQDVGDHTHDALIYQPTDQILERYKPFLQGIMDLRAGLASTPAAERVLELMRAVTDPAQLEELEVRLDAIGEWAHGTHVAGILLQGVPQARLAIFRSAWAGEARLYHHRGPTDEELAEERANVLAIAQFVNAHGIKVVNASLGFSRSYVEDALRHERERYASDDAVRVRAREVHAHRAATWRQVFEQCPGTLFVVAAGNENRDVVEYEDVPANIDLPNVLVVGAVDRFGEWAVFTNSNPARVRIFDFGVEVPSLIPDGTTVPLSGTSMASPNVANLAAKLYAIRPDLTPADAITIMLETGDPIAAPFNGVIANEERAAERLRRERPGRRPRRAAP